MGPASFVLRIAGANGRPAGVGFLVDDRHALTCAHVVNLALGRDARAQDAPADADAIGVSLPLTDFADPLQATVSHWVAPAVNGAGGDVACLRLTSALPDALATLPRAALGDGRAGSTAQVFGYPTDPEFGVRATGVWSSVILRERVGSGLLQLDVTSDTAITAQRGFSGSPVWDPDSRAVVGMFVATGSLGSRDGYAALAERLHTHVVEWIPGLARAVANPYRGLRAFGVDDAGLFVGREAEAAALAQKVQATPVTCLTGASGVGKSSLVSAGLVSALGRGWHHVHFRPATHPFLALAQTLCAEVGDTGLETIERHARRAEVDGIGELSEIVMRHHGAEALLVVCDQFEQIFAPSVPTAARAGFCELMLGRGDLPPGVHLLLVVRDDFLSQLFAPSYAASCLQDRIVPVSPLSAEQLERVIVEPAAAAGVHYASGLAERLAEEADRTGGLPLLQFALSELWERRQDDEIGYAAYKEIGGVTGGLDTRAEEAFQRLTDQGHAPEAVRQALLALVQRMPDGQTVTRSATREMLGADGWRIAQQLVSDRLLVASHPGPQVRFAHEALIDGWAQLASWIKDEQEFLQWRSEVEAAARAWVEDERDPSSLYRGTRLASADTFTSRRQSLEPLAREFLKASADAQSSELRREKQRSRLFLWLSIGLAGVVVVAVILAIVADQNASEAEAARIDAESRGLAAAATSNLEKDVDLSALLAVQAHRLAPKSFEARSALVAAAFRMDMPQARLHHGNAPVTHVAFSQDGRYLASTDGNAVRVWSLERLEPVSPRRVAEGDVVGFRPDGRVLATWAERRIGGHEHGGVLERWAVPSLEPHGKPLGTVYEDIDSFAFSPNSRVLAVGREGKVQLYDERTSRRLGEALIGTRPEQASTPTQYADFSYVGTVRFSADGRWVAAAISDGLWVWNVKTHKRLGQPLYTGGASDFVFTGERELVTSDGESLTRWNFRTGKQLGSRRARVAAFSADGRRGLRIVDDAAQLIDVRHGTELGTPAQRTLATSAALAPDGSTAATSGSDGDVRLWALNPLHPPKPRGVPALILGNGATGVAPGLPNARLWNLRTGRAYGAPLPYATTYTFSPDGRILTSVDGKGLVQFWDPRSGLPKAKSLTVVPNSRVVYGPGSSSIVAVSTLRGIRLWDSTRNRFVSPPILAIGALALSADTRRVTILDADSRVRRFDTRSGRSIARPFRVAAGATLSRDGRFVADTGPPDAVNYDKPKDIRIWSVAERRIVTTVRSVVLPTVLHFTSQGVLLYTANRALQAWDIAEHRALGDPRAVEFLGVPSLSPDERLLATTDAQGKTLFVDVSRWTQPFGKTLRWVCNVIGHGLSKADWHEFLPRDEYRSACP